MKKVFVLILALILVFQCSCSTKSISFDYRAEKVVYCLNPSGPTPFEYVDITEKADIDYIMSQYKGLKFEKTEELVMAGVQPIEFISDGSTYYIMHDGSYFGDTDTMYKVKNPREIDSASIKNMVESWVNTGKYKIYTK